MIESSELNPNHPTTIKVREHWHKLCAVVMFKHGLTEVEVKPADVDAFVERFGSRGAIVCDTNGGKLVLRLVHERDTDRLAREAGGLPA